jgi:hypothetical protein
MYLGREKRPLTTKWGEFKTIIGDREVAMLEEEFDQYMDVLGEQGWELVSCTPIAVWWQSDYRGMTTRINYVFKRPKP